MDLTKYDLAAEERANAPVRAYLALLAEKGYPQKLLDAVPRAEKLLAAAQKIVARLQREYPLRGNENRPLWLAGRITQLHRNFIRPFYEHYSTLTVRLKELASRMAGAKAADFTSYDVRVLAQLDIERGNSYLSEVLWLEQLPERAGGEEKEIVEWMAAPWGGASDRNMPTPPVTFDPSLIDRGEQNKQYDTFDPRK